ncbi:hypothetical protein BDP27DRAFT_1220554 [Rhodocollybia butyracea]|uniref:Reverse transcriptase zinc-binding domain-containing protein n=1 Tax=Rhodocollybia butyracea TaxID=206335 RepID=A0A9P5U868_9AGAR|nr:hypothetical protein BDP27DRAFT_1220554 [Rhodocollybia butyracea]
MRLPKNLSESAEEISGRIPSEEALWKSIRHKMGSYWDNIPGYEPRGVCVHCGTTDSMEHILLECSCPPKSGN